MINWTNTALVVLTSTFFLVTLPALWALVGLTRTNLRPEDADHRAAGVIADLQWQVCHLEDRNRVQAEMLRKMQAERRKDVMKEIARAQVASFNPADFRSDHARFHDHHTRRVAQPNPAVTDEGDPRN